MREHAWIAASVAAILCSALSAGCPTSRTTDACNDAQLAVERFVEDNRSCTTDADCVRVHDECLTYSHGATEACCTAYLRAGYDAAELDVRVQRSVDACQDLALHGRCLGCCLMLSPPAACNDGVCGPESTRIDAGPCADVDGPCETRADCCGGLICVTNRCGLAI